MCEVFASARSMGPCAPRTSSPPPKTIDIIDEKPFSSPAKQGFHRFFVDFQRVSFDVHHFFGFSIHL